MFRKGRTTTNSEFCKNTPIRVLMQDVLVTSSYTSNNHSNNRSSCASGSGSLLDAFAESLYDALNEYECEMVESRLNDRVISTNGTTVNESVSGIDGGGGGGGGSNDDILSSSSQNGLDQQQQQEYLQQQQQQHSIYGSIPIKTRGGSIYSSLEYCMFALGLMGTTTNTNSSQASLSLTGSNALYPKQAIMPAVILITDGVATGAGTSEMIAKDFCRMLARDFVAFTVIQVGSRNGFYPG